MNQPSLEIEVKPPNSPNENPTFYLNGVLDEKADLSPLYDHPFTAINIDLENLRRINSYGIKVWILEIQKISKAQLTLQKCSMPFVDQMSLLPRFIGNARVKSIFLPYFCPECEKEISRCVEIEKLVTLLLKFQLDETFSCEKCDGLLEFYDEVTAYFHFMLEQIDALALEPADAEALKNLLK